MNRSLFVCVVLKFLIYHWFCYEWTYLSGVIPCAAFVLKTVCHSLPCSYRWRQINVFASPLNCPPTRNLHCCASFLCSQLTSNNCVPFASIFQCFEGKQHPHSLHLAPIHFPPTISRRFRHFLWLLLRFLVRHGSMMSSWGLKHRRSLQTLSCCSIQRFAASQGHCCCTSHDCSKSQQWFWSRKLASWTSEKWNLHRLWKFVKASPNNKMTIILQFIGWLNKQRQKMHKQLNLDCCGWKVVENSTLTWKWSKTAQQPTIWLQIVLTSHTKFWVCIFVWPGPTECSAC